MLFHAGGITCGGRVYVRESVENTLDWMRSCSNDQVQVLRIQPIRRHC